MLLTLDTENSDNLPNFASGHDHDRPCVFWGNTAKQINVPAIGRFPVGTAVEAAGNGLAAVRVRLDGVPTAAA